jgi:23S rRNA (pseudouridine1915-N3)-methyltransferase
MKIEILLLGRTKSPYLQQGIDDYRKRLLRFNAVELVDIKVKKPSTRSEAEIKAAESRLIEEKIAESAYRVALDCNGRQYGSEAFSTFLDQLEQRSIQTLSFIIGGPLGLAAEQLEKADEILSLSKMTFTHDMARLLLLEQLYRAYTIKAGTRYHK